MKRVIIVVEGQTEEAFVNQVLAPDLGTKQIYATATRITTSRNTRAVHKGGFVNFDHLNRDVTQLLSQDQHCYVSCMVDLYKLPSSVPGYEAAQELADAYAKVQFLEQALASHFNSTRFIPYIQLHEFEALLYADPDAAGRVTARSFVAQMMNKALLQAHGNPELVNQTPTGAPSKRLLAAFDPYEKVVQGIQIAQLVGLATMKAKCAHFKSWYDQLAAL